MHAIWFLKSLKALFETISTNPRSTHSFLLYSSRLPSSSGTSLVCFSDGLRVTATTTTSSFFLRPCLCCCVSQQPLFGCVSHRRRDQPVAESFQPPFHVFPAKAAKEITGTATSGHSSSTRWVSPYLYICFQSLGSSISRVLLSTLLFLFLSSCMLVVVGEPASSDENSHRRPPWSWWQVVVVLNDVSGGVLSCVLMVKWFIKSLGTYQIRNAHKVITCVLSRFVLLCSCTFLTHLKSDLDRSCLT